jgi:hypothetical protein
MCYVYWQMGLASCFFIFNMSAINVKECILHGKYNKSLTFIAQKTAGESPWFCTFIVIIILVETTSLSVRIELNIMQILSIKLMVIYNVVSVLFENTAVHSLFLSHKFPKKAIYKATIFRQFILNILTQNWPQNSLYFHNTLYNSNANIFTISLPFFLFENKQYPWKNRGPGPAHGLTGTSSKDSLKHPTFFDSCQDQPRPEKPGSWSWWRGMCFDSFRWKKLLNVKKKWSLFYYQIYNRNSARRNIRTLYFAALGQTALNVSKIHINKLWFKDSIICYN